VINGVVQSAPMPGPRMAVLPAFTGHVIGQIGNLDAPLLSELARVRTRASPIGREAIASVLGTLGTKSTHPEMALPLLIELAKDREPIVRTRAYLSLARLKVPDEPVLAILAPACLSETDPATIDAVTTSLLERGESNRTISTALKQFCERKEVDPQVRLRAAEYLWRNEGQTNLYLRALGDLVANGKDGKWAALEALATFAPEFGEVVPLIARGLEDPKPFIRSKAAMTLGQLGAVARPATPALARALDDGEENVRYTAQEALERIKAPMEAAKP
ncbi:MAG TPA: HEAT repeat domain-containing protein, partial [Verrucomicrobiae bacterium]|nr:HEAT repeat domain-containing protein [Verrucomicrobiae bacterium]